jgi:Zn-dependent M28 family amino/carboxypeptidase
LVFACWDEEETGLVGSEAYSQDAISRRARIDLAVSLEMIGYSTSSVDTQSIPFGFDFLFPEAVAKIESNQNRGDFIAFVHDSSADSGASLLANAADELGLPQVRLGVPNSLLDDPATSDLRRSDHASFWARGFPAIMITDTAEYRNPNYHCSVGDDLPSDLDFDFMTQVVSALATGVDRLARAD